MPKLGHVKSITFDLDGHERRNRLDAIVSCPRCGKEVECWAETEAWTKNKNGLWAHSEYGGALGICEDCHIILADCLSDGFCWFDLSQAEMKKT